MTVHRVPDVHHRLWTTRHTPALEISDGDVLEFSAPEAAGGQFDDFRPGDPVPALKPELLYPMLGPVMVDGAEPGDTLELELLDFTPEGWGWTAVLPGMGLLPDDFPDPHLHRWEFPAEGDGTATADFLDVARVPVRPFLGVLACAPDTDEPLDVMPPGPFGGNIDCRDLVAGTRVFLPVQTPGARLTLADPHAAQGDGEVCVSAIEAPLDGRLRVTLHRGRSIPTPQFRTSGPLRPGIEDAGFYATMGIGPDVRLAARDAVRYMVDHISSTYRLDPLDAYVLASVVVDLKISEAVDEPHWVVSAYLPLSVMNA